LFFLLDQKELKNQENPIQTFPAGYSPHGGFSGQRTVNASHL
jgi:hypothetical protein